MYVLNAYVNIYLSKNEQFVWHIFIFHVFKNICEFVNTENLDMTLDYARRDING